MKTGFPIEEDLSVRAKNTRFTCQMAVSNAAREHRRSVCVNLAPPVVICDYWGSSIGYKVPQTRHTSILSQGFY